MAQSIVAASTHAAPAPAGPHTSGVAPRLHERAFDILAAQILAGALAPGSRLLESHVAERFGISRAPARQALSRLEQIGLVRRAEGHGFVVEPPPGVSPIPPVAAVAHGAGAAEPLQLAPESTCERIAKDVEREVVTRSAFGAFRVVENHLAAHYGVSRTVARDVLSRLHQRGVVRKDARLHWYAPALSPAYVAELFEMRAILEPAALRLAAPRLPPGILARLRANLETALAHPAAVDGAQLSALEEELHISLLGHCGNATLMEALSAYQTLLVALTFLHDFAARAPGVEPFLAEHLEVADRLASGRADAAVDALRAHLDGSLGRAMERLERVRRQFSPGPLPYLSPL